MSDQDGSEFLPPDLSEALFQQTAAQQSNDQEAQERADKYVKEESQKLDEQSKNN